MRARARRDNATTRARVTALSSLRLVVIPHPHCRQTRQREQGRRDDAAWSHRCVVVVGEDEGGRERGHYSHSNTNKSAYKNAFLFAFAWQGDGNGKG